MSKIQRSKRNMEDRRRRAREVQARRVGRSVADQLLLIERRPGESAREKARLLKSLEKPIKPSVEETVKQPKTLKAKERKLHEKKRGGPELDRD